MIFKIGDKVSFTNENGSLFHGEIEKINFINNSVRIRYDPGPYIRDAFKNGTTSIWKNMNHSSLNVDSEIHLDIRGKNE